MAALLPKRHKVQATAAVIQVSTAGHATVASGADGAPERKIMTKG
jgi:hypothetical protein